MQYMLSILRRGNDVSRVSEGGKIHGKMRWVATGDEIIWRGRETASDRRTYRSYEGADLRKIGRKIGPRPRPWFDRAKHVLRGVSS
jgi:hypothetical protein